jgi:ABC-type transport system substrate-binding protein
MLWSRWIIFGIPLTLAALTVWSAHQAAANRTARGDEIVIASGEGIAPTLNPFLPSCEVDRRVAALVHEPLLRIGADGRIAPALAEKWSWSQTSSVWFAGRTFAEDAGRNLARLDAAAREALGLETVELAGTEIRLRFARPGAQAPARLMGALAAFGPLPVEFVRVDLGEAARGYHDFFMKNSVEREQVKRVWFDGPNAYELAICGETVKFIQELNLFYENRPALRPRVRSLGSAPMLHRPVLELTLRSGARFADGGEVTVDDVGASLGFVLEQPWPVAGREALRLIAGWEKKDARTLRVPFKEIDGPSITAFVGLPVLPASWLARHAEAFARGDARAFLEQPPPGTGTARVESAGPGSIVVHAGRRVKFLLDQPPKTLRMGFAMRSVDGFWPQWREAAVLSTQRDVVLRSTPPRSRLLVLWNCRKPPLDDARVRAALGLATDRESLIRDLLFGQGSIHEGIFRPGLWFSQAVAPPPFDADRARQMLRELGWSIEGDKLLKDGKPFRFELLTVAGNAERAEIAEKLRKNWATLGIEVTVTPVAQGELVHPRLTEHRFDAALLGLDFETSWDQAPFWHSSQARGGLNFSGLTDPTLDGLLEALRVEYDPDKVPALAHDAENRIVSFHPFLPLFSGGSPVALRREVLSSSADVRALLSGNDETWQFPPQP